MSPEDRAREGIFLAFQYPVEIPGVSNMYFLKAALNTIRKHRGIDELDAMDFLNLVREKMQIMKMDQTLLNRPVNAGFSGGEKKRNEIFQMAVLEPKLAVLDETDSGLDIDALRIVAAGVNAMRAPERAMIVVTHYQRLLNEIVPDFVHVLAEGRIVKSGGKELALELEAEGYAGSLRRGGGRQSMTAVSEQTGAWLELFSNQLPAPAWLQPLRDSAFARFAELGFPTTQERRVALHQRRAHRAHDIRGRPAGRGADQIRQGPDPTGLRQRTPGVASREPAQRPRSRRIRRRSGGGRPAPGQVRLLRRERLRRAQHRDDRRWRVHPRGARRGNRRAHRDLLPHHRHRAAHRGSPARPDPGGRGRALHHRGALPGRGRRRLLQQRRHRNRGRRSRRGGSLQGPAGNRQRVPHLDPASHPGPQRRPSPRTPFRWAARWCATTPTPRSPRAPTPR